MLKTFTEFINKFHLKNQATSNLKLQHVVLNNLALNAKF